MTRYHAHRQPFARSILWDVAVIVGWICVFIALTAVEPVR